MEGNTGQKWNWINLYQTAWCIISYHVVTYPAKQQTSRWTDIPYPIHRVIVSDMPLHRTVCCCIMPGAAKLSSVCGDRVWVIPQNCSLFCYIILDETIFWAECDVTVTNRPLHRPLCCYIAFSDATLWAVCQDMLIGSLRYGDYGLRTTAGRALSFVRSTGLSRANIER